MVHIEDVLFLSLAQTGDTYSFGAAVNFNDPDPTAFDCSGLVQWSCARAGVQPDVPRRSFEQARHCLNLPDKARSVDEGVATRGALLFKFLDGQDRPLTVDELRTITDRPAHAHVAWSLGDGSRRHVPCTKTAPRLRAIQARCALRAYASWAASQKALINGDLVRASANAG